MNSDRKKGKKVWGSFSFRKEFRITRKRKVRYDVTNTSLECRNKLEFCPSQDKIGVIDSNRLQSLDDIIICLYLNEIIISFLF